MREIRSSGSVRGGVGNDPAYSAGGVLDRPGLPPGPVELVEAGIGIGLQDAGIVLEMAARMLGLAVR